MRKRNLRYGILIFLSLLLTGCWDRKELNQLAITSATALDWDGKEWTVSYQVVIPQSIANPNTGGSPGQQAPVMVFSTSGGTIRGAVQKSSREMPRSLFFAHNRVIVIGEKAAEQGISQLLDVYLRNSDSRETVSILVTGGEGRTIIEQIIPLEKVPGAAIKNMIRNEENNSSNYNQLMMYQMMMGMTGDSPFTLIPEIIISGKGENTSISKLTKTSFTNKLRLGRMSIFKKDKLIGWFTPDEEYGISWIRNSIKRSTLYFDCKQGNDNLKAALRIERNKSDMKPILSENGSLIMHLDVNANGTLMEIGCPCDPTKPEDVRALEQAAAAELTRLITSSFHSAVQKKADVFRLAEETHKHHPKLWNQVKANWDEQFANLQLETNVQVHIERIGMSGKSFNQITNGDSK